MDKPIPKLRTDLNINLVNDKEKEIVFLQDVEGFAEEPIGITMDMFMILQALDGNLTSNQLKGIFTEKGADDDIANAIIDNIHKIQELGYLQTPEYLEEIEKAKKEYLELPFRPPICAGSSYSNQAELLVPELDEFLNSVKPEDIKPGAKSLVVPHIDFKVGKKSAETYSAGYHSIRNNNADVFVIFGTSHFASSDYFMLSEKDYQTPLGIAKTDIELLDSLKNNYPDLTLDEFAHKNEHSIELQVVLLQHYFKNRNIKILPVLVGSFHDFILNGSEPDESKEVAHFLSALDKSLKEHGRNPMYIASVDFAHIGKKFGDEFDAKTKLEELSNVDHELIEKLIANDHRGFFSNIKNDEDKWKVCGTSPLYSFLNMHEKGKGELLKYNQWYEEPTQSAVSFASIAYY